MGLRIFSRLPTLLVLQLGRRRWATDGAPAQVPDGKKDTKLQLGRRRWATDGQLNTPSATPDTVGFNWAVAVGPRMVSEHLPRTATITKLQLGRRRWATDGACLDMIEDTIHRLLQLGRRRWATDGIIFI